MESFSLLKYWRGGGGGTTTTTTLHSTAASAVTTIAAAALMQEPESEDDEARSADDDDGPFIDLEFAVPDEDHEIVEGEERELDFALGSDGEIPADPSLCLSPSGGLFFKGKLLPLEQSSLVFQEPNSKHQFLHKFRVFALGLKKPRSSSTPKQSAAANSNSGGGNKPFTVKLKSEEIPIASLFTRDNSSRSSGGGSNNGRAPAKLPQMEDGSNGMEEKRSSKEIVNKYLNKIKPLYVKVSKKHSEKLRSPTATNTKAAETQDKAPAQTGGAGGAHLPPGLRVVCKHLGKSRSASSAAVAAAATSPPAAVKRRDDSLLQQQDGIQSAIAHCKRSFNGTRDGESPLGRSRSDSYDERYSTEKCKDDCV